MVKKKASVHDQLLMAVDQDDEDAASFCLDAGADPNTVDAYGDTPLRKAIINGNLEMVHLLLDHQARWEILPDGRGTYLQEAAKGGQLDIVKELLGFGADANDGSLAQACLSDEADVAAFLIERGADVHWTDASGATPLHFAMEANATRTTRLLLEKGANPNAPDHEGNTPLHRLARLATLEDGEPLVALALSKGARLNLKNEDGQTPVQLAKDKTFKALLQKCAKAA